MIFFSYFSWVDFFGSFSFQLPSNSCDDFTEELPLHTKPWLSTSSRRQTSRLWRFREVWVTPGVKFAITSSLQENKNEIRGRLMIVVIITMVSDTKNKTFQNHICFCFKGLFGLMWNFLAPSYTCSQYNSIRMLAFWITCKYTMIIKA